MESNRETQTTSTKGKVQSGSAIAQVIKFKQRKHLTKPDAMSKPKLCSYRANSGGFGWGANIVNLQPVCWYKKRQEENSDEAERDVSMHRPARKNEAPRRRATNHFMNLQ